MLNKLTSHMATTWRSSKQKTAKSQIQFLIFTAGSQFSSASTEIRLWAGISGIWFPAGHEADHLPPFNAQVKNGQSHTCSHQN